MRESLNIRFKEHLDIQYIDYSKIYEGRLFEPDLSISDLNWILLFLGIFYVQRIKNVYLILD